MPRRQRRKHVLEPAINERLGDVRCPTLVIVGDEDIADMQGIAAHVAASIGDARLETVAGASHLPSLERPDEVNALILGFLAEFTSRRSLMKPNRSIPSAAVVPVLVYPDVREAVAWLETAFGFAERVRIGESHRSQLSVGDGRRGDRRRRAEGPATAARRRGDAPGDGAGRRRGRPLRARSAQRREDPDGADRLRVRRAAVPGAGSRGSHVDVHGDPRRRRARIVGRDARRRPRSSRSSARRRCR